MLTEATLQKMLKKIEDKEKICVLAFECEHENGYGRLVLDEKQNLERIAEVKDASALEKKITLCNSGVIAIHSDQVLAIVAAIKNRNAAGEFYLTDIIEVAKNFGVKSGFVVAHSNEVLGVNSKVELAIVEKFKQNELRKKFMDQGVTLVDPDSVYFSSDTKIEPEVIIYPSVFFGPNVSIKRGASIRSFSHIEGANIAELAVVGPFARIRPGSEIEREARVGNFVEVKKSVIKKGAKVNHLSYIGDAEIGEETNIGAGTITCNYDGYRKFKTKIGKKVFIGSNTAHIAPLQIADEAIIAAGSVITKNVGKDELAIARASQTNISNGGKKYHQKKSS